MRGRICHFWHLLCSFGCKQTKHIVSSLLLLLKKEKAQKEEKERKRRPQEEEEGGDYIYIKFPIQIFVVFG